MFRREVLTREMICLSLANMFFWAGNNIFLPVLPQYFKTWGLSTFEVGIIIGAMAIGAMSCRVIAGKAIDRYGTVIVACIGLIISLLAISGYLVANTMATALLCALAQGMGVACFSPAATTMATLMHDKDYIGDVFAIFTFLGMAGASGATVIANILYGKLGIIGVIGAGAGFTFAGFLLIPKRATIRVALSDFAVRPMQEIVKNPGLYIPTFSMLATNICYAGAMTYLPMLMLGRAITDFNSFFVTYAVIVTVARLFVRHICDKFGALRIELWSVMLTGLAMLLLVGAYNWLTLSICGVITGLAIGVAYPAMGTTVTSHTEPENRGTAFGIFTLAADIGFMLGATGLSLVAAIWDYQAAFMLAGGYALLYGLVHKLWLSGKLAETTA